jgi:hypothetical protein
MEIKLWKKNDHVFFIDFKSVIVKIWHKKLAQKIFRIYLTVMPHYWSALDFWKIEFGKSSWTNLIFCLFGTWILLPVQPAKFKFEIDKKQGCQTWFFILDISKINCRLIGGLWWLHWNRGLQQMNDKARATEALGFFYCHN